MRALQDIEARLIHWLLYGYGWAWIGVGTWLLAYVIFVTLREPFAGGLLK